MKKERCLACGTAMKVGRENVKYDSLPGTTLVGVTVCRCPNCGEYEVEIPVVEKLNRVLAMEVVRKKGRLSADEVRFLRKAMGWSGADFTRYMGVERATVSRWETGKERIGAQADRLLRLLVVCKKPVDEYLVEAEPTLAAMRIEAHEAQNDWTAQSVTAHA